MEFLPNEILPSAQEFAENMQVGSEEGFYIPDMMEIQDKMGLLKAEKRKK
jgi:hypothetical protein